MSISQKDIVKMMQEFSENEENWAKNSKFYNRIMSDGNIFNPYLHRRFLPTQFRNLTTNVFRSSGENTQMSKQDFIKKSISYCSTNHIIDCITKEIGLLAFLEDRDPMAFDERSAITPLNQCKKAYMDLYDYLDHCTITIWHTSGFMEEKQKSYEDISNAKSYAELDKILHTSWKTSFPNYSYGQSKYIMGAKIYKAFWIYPLVHYACACQKFYNMFLLAGAYYSLKNYYMFDDAIVDRRAKLNALHDMTINQQKDWGNLMNKYCHIMSIDGRIAG